MPKNPPEGYNTVTVQAVVDDAHSLLGFVEEVFDAELLDAFEVDGRIRHAEAVIGDSRIMVSSTSDEFGPFPFMVSVYVDDVDAVYQRALEAGATSLREPQDQFYGDRSSGVMDIHGNQWWISSHIEDVDPEEMQRRIAEMTG